MVHILRHLVLITKGDLRTNIFPKRKTNIQVFILDFVAKENFLQWLVWILPLVMCLWQHNTIFVIFLQVAELTRSLRVGGDLYRHSRLRYFTLLIDSEFEIYNITSNLPYVHWIISPDSSENKYSEYLFKFVWGFCGLCTGIQCDHVLRHILVRYASCFCVFASLKWWVSILT